jgi:hypothetical protein
MKKGLLLLIMFVVFGLSAQEKFSNYQNRYLDKNFDIKISIKNKNDFKLFIMAYGMDKLYDTGGIVVPKENYSEFLTAIKGAKEKYVEWSKTAKENDVKDFQKYIKVDAQTMGYFEAGDEWNFQFTVWLKFRFKVTEKGEPLLIMDTGKLTSSKNKYRDCDGFVIVFTSSEDIDSFLDKISPVKVQSFLDSKTDKNDLFKD